MKTKTLIIPSVDIDNSYCLSGMEINNECDCIYIAVSQANTGKFYCTISVDSNTGWDNFMEDLETDAGPFDTYQAATDYGLYVGMDWLTDNEVLNDESLNDSKRVTLQAEVDARSGDYPSAMND